MQTQTWMIQYRPDGVPWNRAPGWYYGTTDAVQPSPTSELHCLGSAAVGPFETAQEACMDLTRAFVTADALGPVEDREEGDGAE